MKRTACLLLSAVFFLSAFAQTDSVEHSLPVKTLGEVIIKAYEQNRKLAEVAAPIGYIGQQDLNRYGNTSIVPALNAVPGVRMEERSPGSYRLNVRGSTLRSPFGVRDVKVYWNDIPLTDPGGNTYLNGQGYYNFQSLEIIKGPAGSLYGAGIGGAILIHSLPSTWAPGINVEYSNGSFQTNSLHAAIRLGDENRKTNFDYSHQTSSGYRSQTNMRRDVASWETEVKATGKQSLHAFILYSDLFYQTPGALTLAQYNADPRQARPGSGSAPGAVQNKAAIYQKTFIAGLSSTYQFSAHWQNTTAFYGAYTDFLNPGIRVYEIRKEPHAGGRTVFRYTDQWNGVTLQFNAGAEAQKGFFNTKDYANKLGVTDTLQSDDNINNWQYMVFAQADLLLPHGWAITLGGSYNKSAVQFTRLSVVPPALQSRTFENKLPPRLAILKKLTPGLSAYASVARGFSTRPFLNCCVPMACWVPTCNPKTGWIMNWALKAICCRAGYMPT